MDLTDEQILNFVCSNYDDIPDFNYEMLDQVTVRLCELHPRHPEILLKLYDLFNHGALPFRALYRVGELGNVRLFVILVSYVKTIRDIVANDIIKSSEDNRHSSAQFANCLYDIVSRLQGDRDEVLEYIDKIIVDSMTKLYKNGFSDVIPIAINTPGISVLAYAAVENNDTDVVKYIAKHTTIDYAALLTHAFNIKSDKKTIRFVFEKYAGRKISAKENNLLSMDITEFQKNIKF